MIFSSFGEAVDKPCENVLTYPYQCFREKFCNLPRELLQGLTQLLGLAVVLFAWAVLLAVVAAVVYFVVQKSYRLSIYLFHNTRVGRKFGICASRGASSSAGVGTQSSKKFLSTQSFSDFSANLASKVHDAKWIKSVLKKRPFAKSDDSHADDKSHADTADDKSHAESPQKSISKLRLSTPRLLSPKKKETQVELKS